jgi:cell division protein FtsB
VSAQFPDDGRFLDDDDELPFFSFHVRLPRLVDVVAAIVIGACCTLFYKSYINGTHGMMAERSILQERDLLKGQSTALDRRIDAQLNLNRRISDTYLDLDLLEERARVLLGYQHADDVLIKE